MRLLHTSDWHLGQSLHNFDRHYEHQCFLDWLLETIVAEQADALLVAGDVFDNANPSAASQRQLYSFLQQARARAPQLDIVVIAGNHDSPGRLEAPGPLLEVHGTTVIGYPHRDADGAIAMERMLVPLTGKDGKVGAWVLAVPFLRHGDVPRPAPAPAEQSPADGASADAEADVSPASTSAKPADASGRRATAKSASSKAPAMPSGADGATGTIGDTPAAPSAATCAPAATNDVPAEQAGPAATTTAAAAPARTTGAGDTIEATPAAPVAAAAINDMPAAQAAPATATAAPAAPARVTGAGDTIEATQAAPAATTAAAAAPARTTGADDAIEATTAAPAVTIAAAAATNDLPAEQAGPATATAAATAINDVPAVSDAAAGASAMAGLAPADDASAAPAAPQPDPYLAGIAELYRQAIELAAARAVDGQAIVAMGHCHMVDGTMSADSERRIVIGGTEMLPAGIFPPPIAYAALGHLHLAQQVGPHEHIRYCGSPIPLSFAETSYPHQVLRIDFDGARLQSITALPVPRAVELLRIPAKPAPLEEVVAALAALELPDAPLERQPMLEVRILLNAPEPGLRSSIEQALEGKPVRLAKIETSSAARASFEEAALSLDQLATLQPDDIFKRLYQQRYGSEAPPDQLAAFAELVHA